jgi:hypothetical protein
MITVVNKSDYRVKDLRRLTNRVMKILKKTFTMPPIREVIVESYDSSRWEGQCDGSDKLIVRIGRFVTFPCTWDRIVQLPNWEDLYVALLTWLLMLQYQSMRWNKRTIDERKGRKKHSRADCQHVTVRMINRWRVDAEMKMIYEKAGVYAD